MNFTKSKYVEYLRCVKAAWLTKNKPQERVWDEATLQRFEEGHLVGDLAKGYFGDYVDVTSLAADGQLNFTQMLALTKQHVDGGKENICEAAFSWGGLYCAVDILHREGDGYAIYEVKSTTSVKDEHISDVAYQKYVLEGCGINVTGAYVLHIDKEYVRHGDIDLQGLFCKQNVWDEVCAHQVTIADTLAKAESDLAEAEEPQQELTCNCENCCYFAYCTKDLPKPNVFDSHFAFGKQLKYSEAGIITLEQVNDKAEQDFLSAHPAASKIENVYVEKVKIESFLKRLSSPLYFLDFETMKPIVPLFDGTRPNQQIPFQYSLHIIEQEGGELKHKEFLAESGTDPRRAIAERLVEDIPTDVCVLAYNMSFERGRIAELADAFPDLATHLMAIHDNIVDLIVPFRQQHCYVRAMEGSASIKYVLPALFPDDPELNYHNLDGVHNGTEAMTIFPRIATMPPAEAKQARDNLLRYCCLDTFAMVKVWQKLIELTK